MQGISVKTEQPKVTSNNEVCHNHGNQQMFFFCETCKVSICRDCTVLDHKETAGHDIINISAAKVAHRHKLEDQQNKGRITRTKTQMTIQQTESNIAKLQAKKGSATTSLEYFSQFVHQQLEQWQKKATDAVLKHYDAQQRPLLAKQSRLHDAAKLLNKLISQSGDALKTDDINGVIQVTEKLKTINETTQSYFKHQEKTSLASDLITGSNPLNDELCHWWERYFYSIFPTKFDIKHKEIIAGLKSEITIELQNDEGNVIPLTPGVLTIELIGPDDNSLPVALNNITHSGCSVVVTPEESGTHTMFVIHKGCELESDDPEILVSGNNPVLKFTRRVHRDGYLYSRVVIDNNNCLYVAYRGIKWIQKFSANGDFLGEIVMIPSGEDSVLLDIALDLKNELIICTKRFDAVVKDNNDVDNNNSKKYHIQAFNLDGVLQYKHILNNDILPDSIAVDSHGDLIVVDQNSQRLVKLDMEGNFLSYLAHIGPEGTVCVDGDGNIIASSTFFDTIHIINPEGLFQLEAGSSGSEKGKLNTPTGVAADGEYILVADTLNKRVQVFRYDGTFAFMIESEKDPLKNMYGLAVTKKGHVYVVDPCKECIRMYKYKHVLWQQTW